MARGKLTAEQVLEMRDEYDRLVASDCRLATFYRVRAAQFEVHPDAIRRACKRDTWQSLDEPRIAPNSG